MMGYNPFRDLALHRGYLSEGLGRVARLRNIGRLSCAVGMFEPEV